MSSVTRGNRPLRMFSIVVLVMIVIAHFMEQINLREDWLFWILGAMALNFLQASFTGFCPMLKNGKSACATGCGTPPAATQCCDTAKTKASSESTPVMADPNSCCSGGQCAEPNADHLTIKVLGTGCANCDSTVKLIQTTADEMNVAITLVKVEDVVTIAGYGVMGTPGVVINNKVVHAGSIPTKETVQQWLVEMKLS